MPPGYFGIDLVIPVLIPSTNVPGHTESEDLFTFIAVQFKSIYERAEIVRDKMTARVHYVPCPKHVEIADCFSSDCQLRTSQADLDFIYTNQVSIYINSEKDLNPGFESSESEHENFEICETDDHVCIVTRSFSQLAALDKNVFEIVGKLLNYQYNPFEFAENYSKQMTADAAMNFMSINYPNVDRNLRAARGFNTPLPDQFENISGFSPYNISSAIDLTNRKNTPKPFKEIAKCKKLNKL